MIEPTETSRFRVTGRPPGLRRRSPGSPRSIRWSSDSAPSETRGDSDAKAVAEHDEKATTPLTLRRSAKFASQRRGGCGRDVLCGRHARAFRVATVITFSCVASARVQIGDDPPSAMTIMRSAIASTSGRSDEMTSTARPESASRVMILWTCALIRHRSVRGLVENKRLRIGGQPLGECDFLPVAAGQQRDGLLDCSGLTS